MDWELSSFLLSGLLKVFKNPLVKAAETLTALVQARRPGPSIGPQSSTQTVETVPSPHAEICIDNPDKLGPKEIK